MGFINCLVSYLLELLQKWRRALQMEQDMP